MLKLNGAGEKTVANLLEFIDKIISNNHPAEAANLLPDLVTATAELIKALDR